MRGTIGDACLEADAIDHINACGTGTSKNNLAETLAIRTVFGRRASSIPV
jgi:3-oxoacyl-[acyl-carrier-protein] synthase II